LGATSDNAALEKIGDARIIKKPFVGDELVAKVQAALAKRKAFAEDRG